MRVEEVMSTPVVITSRNVKVKHLRETFDRKGIGAVPVLEEDGTISGIVSLRDLLRADDEQIVQDVMSDRIHIVLPNNQVRDAANTMVSHKIHHLVVMKDGDVIGMLSALDIVKQFALLG
ncbi:MAG: CBS domain-containing protein [Bacteroidetes bacterium]|nr:MAG: CBS domain-containing protein [Bacteroidota bacterium]